MQAETITAPNSADTRSHNEYLAALAGRTILITGAAGFLGTALLHALYNVRCQIIALVHQKECAPAPAESKASLATRQVDLAQPSVWLNVLRESRPDVIVHLAAYEHRRNSTHAPALDLAVNTATLLELLEACRELELKPRLMLASSANIVGCPDAPLVNEETPDGPLTLYAINKLAAEQYLRYYAHTFNLPGVSLRFGNVYGPLPVRDTELESRVVLNSIMRRALAGGPLYLYRNQECVRDFLYVGDAVRAICAVASANTLTPGSKYIVGSGEGYTLKEIVNQIARQVEKLGRPRVEVRFDAESPLAPIEWRGFVADYRRLRSATGWAPEVKLHQGIELTLRAFIQRP